MGACTARDAMGKEVLRYDFAIKFNHLLTLT